MARKRLRGVSDEEIFYGTEPTFDSITITDDNYQSTLANALFWYSKVASASDKKIWLGGWLLERDIEPKLSQIPDEFLTTPGAVARMASRGFPLREQNIAWIIDRVNVLSQKFKKAEVDAKSPKKFKHEIDPVGDKIGSVYDQLEPIIDSVMAQARKSKRAPKIPKLPEIKAKLNGVQTKEVIASFKEQRDEILMASNALSCTSDINEAYPDYTRAQLRRILTIYDDIISHLKQSLAATKAAAPKTARKKRFVPATKKVAKLKFLGSSSEFGISSIDPEKIIGAKKLVAFNTKRRRVEFYYADDQDLGLQIKGSTIENFDGERSGSKTLRNPGVQLPQFVSAPRVRSEKLFGDIKAVQKVMTGRINTHVVLLKVYQ